MAKRMSKGRDKAVYRRTSVKTKRINRATAQGGVRF